MAGSLLPYYLLREFDNAGKLLSGGKMYFYISGTSTPKTVYSDANLTTPLPNPVILSASGTQNIFLGPGSYRVRIEDQFGAQIASPIDGITGTTGSAAEGTNISYAFVKLYADLRTLATTPDVVYVAGKLVEGDGGQGWFQLLTTGTGGLVDDDGIILTKDAGTHVYKRIFDAAIDPKWYGLTYGLASNQAVYLNKAITASGQHNFPVAIAGSTYIAQNISVPSTASVSFNDDGFLVAASAVTVTFADDSTLSCTARSFGTFVSPKIGKRVIDVLKLSYMGDTSDDARMDKLLLASTDPNQKIDIDESVSILASTWIVANKLTISGLVTFTGSSALNWTSKYLDVQPVRQFMVSSSGAVSFNFGNQYAYAEQFGAVANGIADDTTYINYATATGLWQLVANKSYRADGFISFSDLRVQGAGTIVLSVLASTGFSGTTLELDSLTVTKVDGVTWANVTTLVATDCALPGTTYTATNKSISGCSYAGETRYPVYDGTVGPALYNAHLPLVTLKPSLRTDSAGKIYGAGSWTNNCRSWAYNSLVGEPDGIMNIKYVNGYYLLLGTNGALYTSPTGAIWTKRTVPTSQPLLDACWSGTKWVVSGNYTILTSTDLVTWTFEDLGGFSSTGYIRGVASNGSGTIVAAAMGAANNGNGGVLGLSTDHGATWITSNTTSTHVPTCVTYADGLWVVGLNRDGYKYSSDGLAFTTVTVPQTADLANNAIYDITRAYGNWIFVGGGFDVVVGTPYTGNYPLFAWSGDITNAGYWTKMRTTYMPYGCATRVSLVYDTLVAGTYNGYITTSTGVENWTSRYNPIVNSPVVGVADNNATAPASVVALVTGVGMQARLELP